jgi:uncharacterized damage-inducible protein DinB
MQPPSLAELTEENDMIDNLIEAWQVNHRVTLKVVDGLPDEAFMATLSKRGGRDIARQLAHVNSVRQAWLRKADHPEAVRQFTKDESPSREALREEFNTSSEAVERMLRRCYSDGGKVGDFKRDVCVLLGYLIAHESHHRGSILLTAKQCGHSVPED